MNAMRNEDGVELEALMGRLRARREARAGERRAIGMAIAYVEAGGVEAARWALAAAAAAEAKREGEFWRASTRALLDVAGQLARMVAAGRAPRGPDEAPGHASPEGGATWQAGKRGTAA